MEDLTTKIDQYLSGKMLESDRLAFEETLEKDAALQAEVDLQRKTQALLEKAAEIDLKAKVASINAEKIGVNWIKLSGRVAAILIIALIPGYFYLQSRYTDENLYAAYASPYPDRITQMGDEVDTQIHKAMQLYNDEAYADALTIFEEIRKIDPSNTEITLYEAVALMETEQYQEAIDILESALTTAHQNKTAYQWQLILAYLGNNEGEKALQLLDEFLMDNNGYQQENAEALQSDLNSIWR